MPTETLQGDRRITLGSGSTSQTALFAKGTQVTTRENRTVESATLARDTRLDVMVGAGSLPIAFKERTVVKVREDGTVESGTLANDTRLDKKTANGRTESTRVEAGTHVRFAADGSVEG